MTFRIGLIDLSVFGIHKSIDFVCSKAIFEGELLFWVFIVVNCLNLDFLGQRLSRFWFFGISGQNTEPKYWFLAQN